MKSSLKIFEVFKNIRNKQKYVLFLETYFLRFLRI